MNKTTLADEKQFDFYDFFNEEFSKSNEIISREETDLEQKSSLKINSFLDNLLPVIKLIFFYLPGVAVIHLAMMGLALMFFYGDYELFGVLGFLAAGTFLIMLGFGKLLDLKYLKSVLTILMFSFLCAAFWSILAVFIQGDFLGFYAKLTFPLTAFIGYLSKRSVDNEAENL